MATRKRAGNAAVVIATKQEVEAPGPIRTALAELVRTRIQPETDKAVAGIEAAKEEHAASLEAHAAEKSAATQEAVHRTWVAAQAAPAILRRMTAVVLPRTTALIDSEDALEADALLAEDGSRTAFKVTLGKHLALIQEQAAALAETINAAHEAFKEHVATNRHVASLIVPLDKELATLVSTSCTVASLLPRGTLDRYDDRNHRVHIARAVKTALLGSLGRTRAKHFLEYLNLVEASGTR